MMKFILGTKENMTQLFLESGSMTPVTVIKAEPAVVTRIREKDRDGYVAVQIGSGEKKEKNISKPEKGQFKGLGNFRYLREFRLPESEEVAVKEGDSVSLDQFETGDKVRLTGVSKGKGFQGVVKRHKFAGGPRSHGQKHSEREAGSIGATGPQRVLKGTKMPGRMGSDTITVKKASVVKVDTDNNLIYVKGAVPGRKGTLIKITA
ncbi:MAG: 50S ribosomal protein L3 [Candidatus Campbellbacteria bacterium]|nr:50S ribosomal protein L3 [Candidatus Campbellbacteria bacterium]